MYSGKESTWTNVIEAANRYLDHPDIGAIRVVCATIVAHRMKGHPVWLMIIAPPGSGKTELLSALELVTDVHFIDSFTPSTLISGRFEDPRHKGNSGDCSESLLHRLGEQAIVIIRDFSTVLEMKADKRGEIFSQLRCVYDGSFTKEFGTADRLGDRSWSGRWTMVAACTSGIDRHHDDIQSLGERFLFVRWPRVGLTAARRAIRQDNDEKAELSEAIGQLINTAPNSEVAIPSDAEDAIVSIAEIVARARSVVERDYQKNIVSVPEPESPTRLAQQFAQLARGSAALESRLEISGEDIQVCRRVGLDSLQPTRGKIIRALLDGQDPRKLDIAGATCSYAIEDLRVLGLLSDDAFSPLTRELWAKILPILNPVQKAA